MGVDECRDDEHVRISKLEIVEEACDVTFASATTATAVDCAIEFGNTEYAYGTTAIAVRYT